MKLFRTWLLLLLVALIPVRGAMAAAMLCLPQGDIRSERAVVDHQGGGLTASAHDHALHAHEGSVAQHAHEGSTVQHADHESAVQQKADSEAAGSHDCSRCVSSCSLTPLASAPPDWRHPPAQATLNPAPTVPVPSFVSDGEERPPRTI